MVAAGGPSGLRRVRFFLDGKLVATDRTDDQGIWSARLAVRVSRGRHVLLAVATDSRGRSARASHNVRSCDP
jgi:hypothetical protein